MPARTSARRRAYSDGSKTGSCGIVMWACSLNACRRSVSLARMSTDARPSTPPLTFDESRRRLERAKQSIPGGVHSNIRLSELPHPLWFDHADGSHLYDVDGNDLIDY